MMKTTKTGLECSLCQDWTQITVIFPKHIFSPHLSTTVKSEEIMMNKSRPKDISENVGTNKGGHINSISKKMIHQ